MDDYDYTDFLREQGEFDPEVATVEFEHPHKRVTLKIEVDYQVTDHDMDEYYARQRGIERVNRLTQHEWFQLVKERKTLEEMEYGEGTENRQELCTRITML